MNHFLIFITSSLLSATLASAAALPGPDKPSEEYCRRNPGHNFCGDVDRPNPPPRPPSHPPANSQCKRQSVEIVIGEAPGTNVQCAASADGWEIPYIQFRNKNLLGAFSDRCPEIAKEMLRQSKLQGGLKGTFTECVIKITTPGEQVCLPHNNCLITDEKTDTLKIETLLLENKWKFESETILLPH